MSAQTLRRKRQVTFETFRHCEWDECHGLSIYHFSRIMDESDYRTFVNLLGRPEMQLADRTLVVREYQGQVA